jgi:hypothetical protein
MSLLAQTPGQAPAVAATAGALESLESLKVPELRDRCKALNLPHKGVKSVLLARLGSEAGTPAKQASSPPSPISQTDGMADPRGPAPDQYVAVRYYSNLENGGRMSFQPGARITVTRWFGADADTPEQWVTGHLPDGSIGSFPATYLDLVPGGGPG